jgi:hypothetical protein
VDWNEKNTGSVRSESAGIGGRRQAGDAGKSAAAGEGHRAQRATGTRLQGTASAALRIICRLC